MAIGASAPNSFSTKESCLTRKYHQIMRVKYLRICHIHKWIGWWHKSIVTRTRLPNISCLMETLLITTTSNKPGHCQDIWDRNLFMFGLRLNNRTHNEQSMRKSDGRAAAIRPSCWSPLQKTHGYFSDLAIWRWKGYALEPKQCHNTFSSQHHAGQLQNPLQLEHTQPLRQGQQRSRLRNTWSPIVSALPWRPETLVWSSKLWFDARSSSIWAGTSRSKGVVETIVWGV